MMLLTATCYEVRVVLSLFVLFFKDNMSVYDSILECISTCLIYFFVEGNLLIYQTNEYNLLIISTHNKLDRFY